MKFYVGKHLVAMRPLKACINSECYRDSQPFSCHFCPVCGKPLGLNFLSRQQRKEYGKLRLVLRTPEQEIWAPIEVRQDELFDLEQDAIGLLASLDYHEEFERKYSGDIEDLGEFFEDWIIAFGVSQYPEEKE